MHLASRRRLGRVASLLIGALVLAGIVGLIRSPLVARAADASSQVALPWAQQQSWTMSSGPHNNDETNSFPWNSLDFFGGDGRVLAARSGRVHFDACGPGRGYVRIDHGDGYSSTYYHISSIQVTESQWVPAGQYLGNQDIVRLCGGHAGGAHVHFSLWYTPPGLAFSVGDRNQQVDLNNVQLSDWVVYRGTSQSAGCMAPLLGGALQCAPNGAISNDGRVGGSMPALAFPGFFTATVHGSDGAAWWELVGSPPWISIHGGVVGNPAAVVYNGHLNVFVRGTDGFVWQTVQNDTLGWGPWANLGRQATSDPVVTVYSNQLQLWIRGSDGAPWQNFEYLSGGTFYWAGWGSLGGGLYGNPAIGNLGSLFQVAIRGTDGAVWQRSSNGSWGAWASLGGVATSDPAVVILPGQLQVLIRGSDAIVYQNFEYSSGGSYFWSGWLALGGQIVGTPAGVAYGNQFWIVAHGTDGGVWQKFYDSSSGIWSQWTPITGVTATSDPAISVVSNQIQIMVRGSDGNAWKNTHPASGGWTGWQNIGGGLA
jgi:hypothetical protein